MYSGSIIKVSAGLAALVLLAGCRSGPPKEPAIAEAYVGPAVLNVRSDIPTESKVVATVKHGDRVEILQRRRIFLKVRTAGGAQGWVSESQLLSSADMTRLSELAERAAKLPPQGVATTYADLNVHTQPNSHAPSFVVIHSGEKVTVLTELRAPRTDLPRSQLIPRREKKAPPPRKPPSESRYPLTPLPKPPGPPPDWLALSKTDLPADDDSSQSEEAKPVPTDSWSLVRTAAGQTGWALTRRLAMAIPDEVAQYAEGHRIVSYFPLGYVQDENQKKPIWLWTTMSTSGVPYDFNSFRVFVWSLKRHRYETAYIDRKMQGYAPVLLKQVSYGAAHGTPAEYPGFSICEVNSDGQRVRLEFALLGNVVRLAGEVPCETTPAIRLVDALAQPTPVIPGAGPAPPKTSLMQRLKTRLRDVKRRWFSR